MKLTKDVALAYWDHYEAHMRAPFHRETFTSHRSNRPIQVLAYEKVFPECMVFATIGLSLHAAAMDAITEVVVPVDDGLRTVPALIADALFFAVENGICVRHGTLVGGIANLAPKFALAFGKSALYPTACHGFPAPFNRVALPGQADGLVLMGIFVSAPEENLYRTSGPAALEERLEEAGVDPFELRRPPAL